MRADQAINAAKRKSFFGGRASKKMGHPCIQTKYTRIPLEKTRGEKNRRGKWARLEIDVNTAGFRPFLPSAHNYELGKKITANVYKLPICIALSFNNVSYPFSGIVFFFLLDFFSSEKTRFGELSNIDQTLTLIKC